MAKTVIQNPNTRRRVPEIQNPWLWPLAIVLAIVAGVAPPLYVGVGLAGLVLLVLLLRKPVWGAYALVLSVPVQKAVSFPADITVTQLLFVLVLGIWWAWLALRRDRNLVLTPIAIALFFFLVAHLLQCVCQYANKS